MFSQQFQLLLRLLLLVCDSVTIDDFSISYLMELTDIHPILYNILYVMEHQNLHRKLEWKDLVWCKIF